MSAADISHTRTHSCKVPNQIGRAKFQTSTRCRASSVGFKAAWSLHTMVVPTQSAPAAQALRKASGKDKDPLEGGLTLLVPLLIKVKSNSCSALPPTTQHPGGPQHHGTGSQPLNPTVAQNPDHSRTPGPQDLDCNPTIHHSVIKILSNYHPSHVLLCPHACLQLLCVALVEHLKHLLLKPVAAVHTVPVAPRAEAVAVDGGRHLAPQPAVRGHLLRHIEP